MSKKKLIIIFSLLAIISGVGVITAEVILNKKLDNRYKEIAEEHKIVVDRSTEEDMETTEEELSLSSIEVLDSDQVVTKVETYINVLEIPDFNVSCYIYDDTSEESLTYGVGWYPQSRYVGQKGVCAVAGHSSSQYNCIMNGVEKMKFMDNFFVYDSQGIKHTYYVTGVYVVDSKAMSELKTTEEQEEYSIFKIITCTQQGNMRLIIEGTELAEDEVETYKKNYELMKTNDIINISNSIDINIFDIRWESTQLRGTWYYIDLVSDRGFSNKYLRHYYQYINNKEISLYQEVVNYDLSEN